MPTTAFLNIPVSDITASRAFFTALGWHIDEKFSAEQSATVVISDTIYLMLLARPYFQTYVTTEIADATTHTEVMIGLSAEDRAGVDALVDSAFAAGATVAGDLRDLGFMYSRSFRDPDGHFFEVFWLDEQAAVDGPPQ